MTRCRQPQIRNLRTALVLQSIALVFFRGDRRGLSSD
jgi:hypothetical protein